MGSDECFTGELPDSSPGDTTQKGQTRQQKRGTVRRLLESHGSDTMVASAKADVNIRRSAKIWRGEMNRTLLEVVIRGKGGASDDILILGLENESISPLEKLRRQSRFGEGWDKRNLRHVEFAVLIEHGSGDVH